MQQPAIEVRNLRKSFRKRSGFRKTSELWAVDNVSFSVAEGETYGLLGPNGSGKSSLIRILSTLLIADSGEVNMLGLRLPQQQEEVRRIIGRVSVDAAFYKKLSARENLLYTALLYGQNAREAEARAMDILERLGMENTKFSTPLEEMSRGMQQKISIARALMINPPLLLLDEPTRGVDIKAKADEKKLKLYPIMFGKAQVMLGIVKSAKRGTGKFVRSTASPRCTFSNTGPFETILALIGCKRRNRARRASISGIVFKSSGKLRVNAVRSKLSSILASTRRPGSKPGTLSNSTAGGVGIRSRIISVNAPISRSQWAPETCCSSPSCSTRASQLRRSAGLDIRVE